LANETGQTAAQRFSSTIQFCRQRSAVAISYGGDPSGIMRIATMGILAPNLE
jgi:hypothetical protein